MARAARCRLPLDDLVSDDPHPARRHEVLAVLDAADRDVRDESRVRIPVGFRLFLVLGYLDDAPGDRLGLRPLDWEEQIARDPRLRNEVRLDYANPRREFHRSKVLRRCLQFVVGHGLRQLDHRVGVRLSRIGGASKAASKVLYLADEVRGRQSHWCRIFRASLPRWQVTRGASARRRAQASWAVRDYV